MGLDQYVRSISESYRRCIDELGLRLAFWALAVEFTEEHVVASWHGVPSKDSCQLILALRETPKGFVNAEELRKRISSLVHGTNLIHMLVSEEAGYCLSLVLDYSDEYAQSFVVPPAFFLVQLFFRLSAEYKEAVNITSLLGERRSVSEIVQVGVSECASQIGVHFDLTNYGKTDRPPPSASFLDYIQSICYRPEEGSYADDCCLVRNNDTETLIRLLNPVPLANSKGIRKLLEVRSLGSERLSLMAGFVNGHIGPHATGYRFQEAVSKAEEVYVAFNGRGAWDVKQGRDCLLRVSDFKPIFQRTLSYEFGVAKLPVEWTQDFKAQLASLCQLLLNCGKGAAVIVSSHAKEEAKRLGLRGTPVLPFSIIEKSEILKSLVAVDGAVLLDENLACHSFGVIVDGDLNSDSARADRGSRFNCTAAYVDNMGQRGHRGAGFVFSSDGGIDILTVPTS